MRDPANSHGRQHAIATTVLVLILSTPTAITPSLVISQERTGPASGHQDLDTYIAHAARRFGIPQHWIRAVMEVESAGDPRAVSRAGAMGLMQIMPGTWGEMRAEHRLGNDPFDPRDNILAGAAYLRAMYDRFGAPGFLAAYNAGPARYETHFSTGRPLPRETRDYLATLASVIGERADVPHEKARNRRTTDWREAPLFTTNGREASGPTEAVSAGADQPAPERIFVPLSRRETP